MSPYLDSRHRGPQLAVPHLIIKMGLAPKQFPLVLKRIQGNTSLSNLSGLSIKFYGWWSNTGKPNEKSKFGRRLSDSTWSPLGTRRTGISVAEKLGGWRWRWRWRPWQGHRSHHCQGQAVLQGGQLQAGHAVLGRCRENTRIRKMSVISAAQVVVMRFCFTLCLRKALS